MSPGGEYTPKIKLVKCSALKDELLLCLMAFLSFNDFVLQHCFIESVYYEL